MQPKRVLGVDDIQLSNPEFWMRPNEEREGAFASLREERPVSFHEEWEFEFAPLPKGPGYWAVSRHADAASNAAPEPVSTAPWNNPASASALPWPYA